MANLEACYCVTWIRILWIVSKVYLRPGCADRCYNLSSGLAEICNMLQREYEEISFSNYRTW